MAQVIWDDMPISPGIMTPDIQEDPEEELVDDHTGGGPLPTEQHPKLKGRKRILQNLKRISSTPSLAKLGRTPSSSSPAYMGGGRASLSCVSLASTSSRFGHSQGPSYSSSHSSRAFSTAPTSIVTTPIPEEFGLASRVRRLDDNGNFMATRAKSVSVPQEARPGSANALASHLNSSSSSGALDGYFAVPATSTGERRKRKNFHFWENLPGEVRMHILGFLKPKELVRCSMVSKAWEEMCFDGQLWMDLDTEQYYRQIPASSLTKIMSRAGPFLRDLNLRGCVQMPERWGNTGHHISDACRNIQNFCLEGCRIDRSSVHHFLIRNPKLVHINLSGLKDVCNSSMRIIAQGCPQLQHLNVSWCRNVDTRGLSRIVQACSQLRDLRAGEIQGFAERAFMLELFERNTLERLMLSHCPDLDDESLRLLIEGDNPKIDPLTERALVPPRRLCHLDLSRCKALTGRGICYLAGQVPKLIGLQISHLNGVTDDVLSGILATSPFLTHLDLEELDELTNTCLLNLAHAPCSSILRHLNVSYCESMGDVGMLQIVKNCPRLRNVVMDNTRISDLVLTEAALQLRSRDHQEEQARLTHLANSTPDLLDIPPSPAQTTPALHLVVYDCQNVTWTGVREVLSRNAEPRRCNIITLKCFYGYQDTVDEHTKRVLRGDWASAARLERKWAEYMVASEEAGAAGMGASRRRRRRLREAAAMHADEEEGGPRGGRRRARSGGCAVM